MSLPRHPSRRAADLRTRAEARTPADWLADQDVVEYFVKQATREMVERFSVHTAGIDHHSSRVLQIGSHLMNQACGREVVDL